ncbi:hypothetical protein [Catellatospora sichuanensis]|uniref:hypothetical protein n=1 Tax=Catellatospora sichuanensis TaxID=1969805 RepID=UPI001183D5C2|nr:hypothetical protein [Catellatospora sichuanensis]
MIGLRTRRVLARAALRLYPGPVRARYGDELIDLLARSPTPLRDLADLLECALTERTEHLFMVALRRHRWWPPLPALTCAAIALARPDWYPALIPLLLLTVAVPAGMWLGRRAGTDWWQHPVAATALIGLAWLVPFEHFWWRVLCYLLWAACAVGLIHAVHAVRRRGHHLAAATAGTVAGLGLLQAFTVGPVALLIGLTGLEPASPAWQWGWEALRTGIVHAYDPAAGAEAAFYPADYFVPVLLLMPCLAFTLTHAYTAAAPQGAVDGAPTAAVTAAAQ